ncbi:polysaccharide pyruvyl transferase family protein [Hahella sp. CR1]|uniref:polysaccharide pyruvyl transferase family protein n=1 Tax=Hahella sp. CR1 TaxID=2992807 RepID=UPI002442B510|nr:polysaccharide pyruvyl transferase family protein [Hahella sp. CR1]MDG9667851.1 polysaccharide pyruvyl transferase family protein [Hahella sp. CR1]
MSNSLYLKTIEGINRVKRVATKKYSSVLGTIKGNRITAYWWNGETNFGDLITPELLKFYGFTPVHASALSCEVLSTGSILQFSSIDYKGHIIGSGLIKDLEFPMPEAHVLAVRGSLTRDRIKAPSNVPLGDPGLLAPKLLRGERAKKKYILGVIPHYVDANDRRITQLTSRYPSEVKLISVKRKPGEVFKDIDECEYILSSSLHGIISADALGIPNIWMSLSDKVVGGGFKFRDYGTAIDAEPQPYLLAGDETLDQLLKNARIPTTKVKEAQEKLNNVFLSLKSGK